MAEPISEGQEYQRASTKSSNEPFFGVLVMMIIIILLVLLASYGGWFLYHGVQKSRSDALLPSIESIPLAADMAVSEEKVEVPKAEEKSVTTAQGAEINKKIAIKVLNGGATKGSAGVVADLLKSAGYVAVSTGNSVGDYVGVLIAFVSPANQGDAESVRDVLSKKYPSSTAKSAVQGNADMTASPITVIVGK